MRLKPEVEERLKVLVREGMCAELARYLGEIGEAYRSIDKFFAPEGDLYILLRLGEDAVERVKRCFSNAKIVARIHGVATINSSKEDGAELCDEVEAIDRVGGDITDYEMLVSGIDGSAGLAELLDAIRGRGEMYWLPSAATLRGAVEPRTVLEGSLEAYRVEVSSLDLHFGDVWLEASMEARGAKLMVTVELGSRSFSKSEEAVGLLEEVEGKYGVPVEARLILEPDCWP